MPCLTTYTQKYVNARPQMNGLESTFWNRFCSKESSSSFFSSARALSGSGSAAFASLVSFATSSPSGDSTGSNPRASGESRSVSTMTAPNTSAIKPGAHKPQLQPSVRAAVPAKMGAAKPPRLCAMFHMPQYVPRSLAANHDVRIFAQEGAPKPCKMPFIAHNTQNKGSVEEAPKARLTSPVAMSPPPSITEGESTSPTTPETNLEHP